MVRAPSRCDLATAATITTAATLAFGRYAPVGVSLDDGGAWIAGGYDFLRGAQGSGERYNPRTDQLEDGASLALARNFPGVVTLLDGRTLIVGGFHPTMGSLREAELFDPVAGAVTALTARLTAAREAFTTTLLPDGKALIAGGLRAQGLVFQNTGELFDPSDGSFTPVSARMTALRGFHTAQWVEARRAVLLVGGDSGHGELASAERFDPLTQRFEATAGALLHAAKALASARLPDGSVLVTGGQNATDLTLADASRYDPTTDGFVATGAMATRRMAHALTVLADGRVLASGGWSHSTDPPGSTGVLEVYDPRTGRWETLPVTLARPRHDHVALRLSDCRVVIAGGQFAQGMGASTAPREVEVLTIPTRR